MTPLPLRFSSVVCTWTVVNSVNGRLWPIHVVTVPCLVQVRPDIAGLIPVVEVACKSMLVNESCALVPIKAIIGSSSDRHRKS